MPLRAKIDAASPAKLKRLGIDGLKEPKDYFALAKHKDLQESLNVHLIETIEFPHSRYKTRHYYFSDGKKINVWTGNWRWGTRTHYEWLDESR